MFRFPLSQDVDYRYERRFGPGAQHKGVDIMAPRGAAVYAVEAGTAWATIDPKGGNVVYLESINGVRYYYAHLDRWSALLDGGERVEVKISDVLGYVGNTGNARGTEPHLHLQMRRGDVIIDPFDALRDVDPWRDQSSRWQPPPKPGVRRSSSALLIIGALYWMYSRGVR